MFSLELTHLKNAKNLENVHIEGINNKSGIKYNYDKKLVLLNFGEEVVRKYFIVCGFGNMFP